MNDTETTIRTMITRVIPVSLSEVRAESRLRADLGLDSIGAMELVSMIDEDLDLQLEMEDTVDLETVGDILALVERRRPGAAA